MKINELVTEDKIKLSTDPNDYGDCVDNYKATGIVVNIPATELVEFETAAKTKKDDCF